MSCALARPFANLSMPVRVSGALLLAGLLALWVMQISGARVEKDELQNLRMAENLWYHGTMSLDHQAPYTPSMQREPIPIAFMALSIGLGDLIFGKAEHEAYRGGHRAVWLRAQNAIWLTVLCVAVFVIVRTTTGSDRLGLAGAALTGLLPFMPGVVFRVDQLDTEALAATLMLVASFWLARGFTTGRLVSVALAGIGFGLLALVKAATLYIFAGMIAVLGLLAVLPMTRPSLPHVWRSIAVLIVGFAVCAAPWIARNKVNFDTWQLANRAGGVLLTRAIKDGMTPLEYYGTFYAWSPFRPIVGRLLGFSTKDLMRGGRLQKLNRGYSDFAADDLKAQRAGRPDLAISYYRTGQAWMAKIRGELAAQGVANLPRETERVVQHKALGMIRANLPKHLVMTIPFLYRGAFYSFPIAVAALVYSIRRRQYALGLFMLPAFGTIMFYGLLTHFIPRYGSVVLPVSIAALLLLYARVADLEPRTSAAAATA